MAFLSGSKGQNITNIHFTVYRTLSTFSLFFIISVLVHACTHRGIFNRLVLVTYTHAHTYEYSTDYIRIFVMFPFSCISWYIDLTLYCFVLYVLLYASFHVLTSNAFSNNAPTINVGPKIFTPDKLQYTRMAMLEVKFPVGVQSHYTGFVILVSYLTW